MEITRKITIKKAGILGGTKYVLEVKVSLNPEEQAIRDDYGVFDKLILGEVW